MKRRYWWNPNTKRLEEVEPARPLSRLELNLDTHYDGIQATDGTDLSSRAKHRSYMQANGLAMADDFKEAWQAAAKEREAPPRIPGLRDSIGRAMYQMETQSRRKRR